MTTTDITIDGKLFIMEIYLPGEHHDEPDGYITLTEACDALEEPRTCDWFVNKATTPSWCCNTHMFDGTGDYPATGEHPAECNFAESDTICDEHETYDFRGIA